MTEHSKYYVYVHARPDGTVFYVGKGSGGRSNLIVGRNNAYHQNIVRKYGAGEIVVQKVVEGLAEQEAFDLEITLISLFKEAGYKLANLTSGGEGPSGLVRSEESLTRQGLALKQRFVDDPELKIRFVENIRRISALPHVKEIKSATAKARLNDPIVKERWVEAIKRRNADPEFQAKAKAGLTKKFDDPEFARKRSENLKSLWDDADWRSAATAVRKEVANRDHIKAANSARMCDSNRDPCLCGEAEKGPSGP